MTASLNEKQLGIIISALSLTKAENGSRKEIAPRIENIERKISEGKNSFDDFSISELAEIHIGLLKFVDKRGNEPLGSKSANDAVDAVEVLGIVAREIIAYGEKCKAEIEDFESKEKPGTYEVRKKDNEL